MNGSIANGASVIFCLDHHILAEPTYKQIGPLVSGLLRFFHVETNGLENFHQEGLELEPVHCIHQIHRNEPVRIEVFKLTPQPLDENVEVDTLTMVQP
ncbi:hypothetical protein D3C87_1814790 [compost metagenome]